MSHDNKALLAEAIRIREKAYAPYSKFLVGAAIVDENGDIHLGCNVENSSYPEGTCAEAGAIAAMIASGGKRISAIACVGGRGELEECTPCGGCRQRINEFSDENTRVILVDRDGNPVDSGIADLLPDGFRF